MSPSDLELFADRVYRYLREEGAVRTDEHTVADYRTVFQICSDLLIDSSRWRSIKNALNKRGEAEGFSIVYVQGKGHYIGYPGEEITNDIAKYQVAKGWVKHLDTSRERIRNASHRQRFWIDHRYKDFRLEEEEVMYGEER